MKDIVQIKIRKTRSAKKSYSQTGEDIIIKFIFDAININKPSYLDIGAHHPEYLNNTALFYSQGSRGINIEPDPSLFAAFCKKRPHDTNLNIGVATKKGLLPFYMMDPSTLNTFSAKEAKKYESEHGFRIAQKIKLKVDTISNVINKFNDRVFPDFLSIDVEGLDFDLIKSIDFKKSYPKVICIETITYSDRGRGVKQLNITDFLTKQGYMVFADTYINTIFVRKDLWKRNN